ncbi:phytanoyl-CoA dioxygenase family protein [Streptomyces sp. NPDC020858]|uniref:phytanoyl-CoA dioxygenase family protein n=1 Tax=Streptomyces sp. NPDC020858 TaxID=3365097 RepID=UPI00379EC264
MTPNALLLAHDKPTALRPDQLRQFEELGYLILPGFLDRDLVARMKPEVDRWVDDGLRARSIDSVKDPEKFGVPPVMELELPAHGELITWSPLLGILDQLMGAPYAFHHLHSDRQAPDVPGKPWHHDYEHSTQTDRSATMIHALHYLDGLSTDTSSLVVLPGSHRERADKTARVHLGTDPLPGEVVLEELPPGSTVVLHSALFHARRPRPGGLGKPRYFVDASYCEVGPLWPPVKPYWRYMLRRARELNLAPDRPQLFTELTFAEYGGAA